MPRWPIRAPVRRASRLQVPRTSPRLRVTLSADSTEPKSIRSRVHTSVLRWTASTKPLARRGGSVEHRPDVGAGAGQPCQFFLGDPDWLRVMSGGQVLFGLPLRGQLLLRSAYQGAGDQPAFRLDRVVLAFSSLGFIADRSTLSSNAPACRTSRTGVDPAAGAVAVSRGQPSVAGRRSAGTGSDAARPRSSCAFKPSTSRSLKSAGC
jgi:hypothetical protein